MLFWTTAEWEHGVATCITIKNQGLVLHFQVLAQVSKMGLRAIAYWREQIAKERLLTRTKMCQKFLCSPKLIACSQLWNKGLFEIKIHGLGSAPALSLYILGDLLFFSELHQSHHSPRKQENQFSMSFLPFLRQLKLTPPVQDYWLIQLKNWPTSPVDVKSWLCQKRKTHQATEQKAGGSVAALPSDVAISCDGRVMGSDTSQKCLKCFCNLFVIHQVKLPWDFQSLPMHSLFFVPMNSLWLFTTVCCLRVMTCWLSKIGARWASCQGMTARLKNSKEVAHLFPWLCAPLCAPWSRSWQAALKQVSV